MTHLLGWVAAACAATVLVGCGAGPAAPTVNSTIVLKGGWQQVLVSSAIEASGNEITGLAVDPQSNIYLAEQFDGRIEKFSSGGHLIAQWGPFSQPAKVAANAKGNIFTTLDGTNQVVELSPQGVSLAKWDNLGSAGGRLYFPVGLAVDDAGTIFVVDTFNGRVVKLSAGGSFSASWPMPTGEDGQTEPYDVATGPNGNVYVSDAHNHWIDVLSDQGQVLAHWVRGIGGPAFADVKGLQVDRLGNLYAEDVAKNLVLKLTSTGRYMGQFEGPQPPNPPIGPHSEIALDPQGNLYVSTGALVLKLVT